MTIIESNKEILEKFSAYDLRPSLNSIKGIEVGDIKDLKLLYAKKNIDPNTYGFSFCEGLNDVVIGFSERCERIFVNIEEGLVQGSLFPFVITATISSNEYKVFYTIQHYDFKVMDKVDNFSSALCANLTDVSKIIKKYQA